MPADRVPTRFRVQWTDDDGARQEVTATADLAGQTIALHLPGEQTVTVRVVTSRAVQMLLNHITYCVLEPDGPMLTVEARGPRGAWHPSYPQPAARPSGVRYSH